MDESTELSYDDRVLLVKVDRTAGPAGGSDLYEVVRKWWRAAPTQVEKARRVLGVRANRVVAAYEPIHWEVSTDPETEGRVAFHGSHSTDAERWLGLEVAHLFPPGAANPVRYTTVGALLPDTRQEGVAAGASAALEEPLEPLEPLILLLRLNQTWHDGIRSEDLFEATRRWWVMSPTKAELVVRVLAVAGGVVREAYEPVVWNPSPVRGEEHRIGFDGHLAADRGRWIGTDVSTLFPKGSQNPVRYVAAQDLAFDEAPQLGIRASDDAQARISPTNAHEVRSSDPDLSELINPLLVALEQDLLWSMSRAAQELFHSNTLASLMSHHPVASAPVRRLFEGPDPIKRLKVWREWKHIDLVANRVDGRRRFVVENKLYSIPYPAQLERYATQSLPWSTEHGPRGAPDTSYFLLSLMDPTFELPTPWLHVSYNQLLGALKEVDQRDFGSDEVLVDRYRALVRRLVELKDAVDPRQNLDGPFSVQAALGALHHKSFAGPLQRMRFTGLAQLVAETHGTPIPLDVDLSHASGSLTFTRELSADRSIGWQFQESQLRLFVLVRDRGLSGKGDERATARARVAEDEYAAFADHAVVNPVLGRLLEPKTFEPGVWRKFAPDFVYRYRKVHPATTTRLLANALAELTRYVQGWR